MLCGCEAGRTRGASIRADVKVIYPLLRKARGIRMTSGIVALSGKLLGTRVGENAPLRDYAGDVASQTTPSHPC